MILEETFFGLNDKDNLRQGFYNWSYVNNITWANIITFWVEF
jgi:hypothetical protein